MEIQLNIGCTGESILIDNKYVEDVPCTEIEEICNSLISCAESKESLIEILRCLIVEVGTYIPDKEPCEQCGNWGETYKIEI